MKCPNCGHRIKPAAIMGAKGGQATGSKKARTPEQARAAAMARWGKVKK